jgi:hypothetical protein
VRKYRAVPTDLLGNAQPGSTFAVKNAGTADLATIYDDDEIGELANPGVLNGLGEMAFRVPTGTKVDITITNPGTGYSRTFDAVSIGDPVNALYDVKDLGAQGDDAADDTNKIQAALDHCVMVGCGLLLSGGENSRYRISDEIQLPSSGKIPSIISMGGAVIHQTNDAAFCFTWDNTDGEEVFAQGTEISGFEIEAKNGIRLGSAEVSGGSFTAQSFLEGIRLVGLRFTGTYGEDADDHYDDATVDATHSELKGYGVAIKLSKVFDWRIASCWIAGFGIGLALYGCDIGTVGENTRFTSNARHAHVRGFSTFGSTTTFDGCDVLGNHRMDGIFIEGANNTVVRGGYFENSPSMSYFGSDNDFGTRIHTRISSYTDVSVPWGRFDPRYDLEVSHCKWDTNGLLPPCTVGHTYWTVNNQCLARFIDNSDAMPIPHGPGIRTGALDPFRFDADNFENVNGAVSAAWPWETHSGRDAIKYGADGLTAIMTLPCRKILGRRLRIVWNGKYRDDQGFYQIYYRFGTSGSTTLLSESLIGFTNDGTYQEKITFATLPALGTNEVIQLFVNVANDDISLAGFRLEPLAEAPGTFFTAPTTDSPNGRLVQMPTRIGNSSTQSPPPDDKKTLLRLGALGAPDADFVSDYDAVNTATVYFSMPVYGDGTKAAGYLGGNGGGLHYRSDAGNNIYLGGLDHIVFGTWDKDPRANTDAVFTQRGYVYKTGALVFGGDFSDDGTNKLQSRGGIGCYGGHSDIGTAGKGLRVKAGANCKADSGVTLVGGSVTVSNTSITANSQVILTRTNGGGTQGHVTVTISAGVSFTITSTSGSDTSTFSYLIVERIP